MYSLQPAHMDRGCMYSVQPLGMHFVVSLDSFIKVVKAYVVHREILHILSTYRLQEYEAIWQCRADMISFDNQGILARLQIWSKHGEVGQNVPQEPLDDATMPDIAPY